ncbi:hypothetical protein HanRHA438_Chr04g0189671 [Helianthus annuus]|uniref:Secreted protein n=1 Tax=Helianthus annuus TaxID=4232 RepID=A0A251TJY9_HELAN|nr:hypothetical protein HanXRQr2_Chr04g0179991 [Helianthus annuus]KAJ0581977.1 hypothetical protein HanHA300_Chr04g0147171 [Helianthus annuus]KAJ0590099.1 hypothetical protein HanIR_Chr04g0193661 [Helianthus annuus]KAJ0597960.1 hypothetical protein HanHA89_Chr04g0160531 [Helianthus annuus]KAJ0758589.1 hypothetical protein HanLR1_Chr04g0152091 [Helianthus annuus]
MFSRSPHNSLLLIVLSANTLHSHKNGDQSSIKSTHPQPFNPSFSVILSVTGADPRRHSAASSVKKRQREIRAWRKRKTTELSFSGEPHLRWSLGDSSHGGSTHDGVAQHRRQQQRR